MLISFIIIISRELLFIVYLLNQMYQTPAQLRSLSSFCLIQPSSVVTVTVAFYYANVRPIGRVTFIYLRYFFNRCLNQTSNNSSNLYLYYSSSIHRRSILLPPPRTIKRTSSCASETTPTSAACSTGMFAGARRVHPPDLTQL